MKWLTVEEYAKQEEICLAAAYKRINARKPKVKSRVLFGRIVVKEITANKKITT